jgi:hypothetical protein
VVAKTGTRDPGVTEIVTVAGLDPQRLDWVARLYGKADPKYVDRAFLEHLFLRNPIGPSLHAFAVDGERPVGHCCVVRTRARYGADELPAGKLEALWLEEPYRGRQAGGQPVVRSLLSRLYAFSDEQGLQVVHALATPHIGRIIDFTPVEDIGRRSFVSAIAGRGLGVRTLASVQRALRSAAALQPRRATIRKPSAADADLIDGPMPPPGRWAIVAEDAWEWYRSSPLLVVLEVDGCRALVQLPAAGREPLRLVGWHADRPTLGAALHLLSAAGRVARERDAATLRFQPWPGPAGDGVLARACRLVGFVQRDDLTTLWVRTSDPKLAAADRIVSTPLFYLGF